MQKSVLRDHKPWSKNLLKTLLVMKLTIFIMLFTVFQVTANPSSGQNISLSLNNSEIKTVLKTIERDGNFRFLFNADLKDIKKIVNFSVTNLPLSEALNLLFSGTALTYKMLDNNLVVVLSANAEDNIAINVTGKVTNENGEPLAGASVQEKGAKKGNSTNNNGNYSITVDNNATLVITSVGYEPTEVKVNNRSVIDVKLTLLNIKINEVVVVGYGTQKNQT